MKKTDRKIRKNLRTDAPCVPEGFTETFRRTLDEIKTTNRRSHRRLWQTAAVAAAVVAVTFVIIPNASQSAAYAMQDIPVIGRIVEVVTINKKHINEADWHENVEVAQIEGDKALSSQIDYINADIRELTDIAVSQFEEERKELERRNLTAHTGLDISYDVLMNTDKWFTIRINVFYSAGSGIAEQHFYHIDKTKGIVAGLSDLFDDNFDYVSVFSREVKNQMKAQMKSDSSRTYWLGTGRELGYEFDKIDREQNFYFDDDGNIVLVFDKYEAGPGYMGCPEFTISAKLFAKHLK